MKTVELYPMTQEKPQIASCVYETCLDVARLIGYELGEKATVGEVIALLYAATQNNVKMHASVNQCLSNSKL